MKSNMKISRLKSKTAEMPSNGRPAGWSGSAVNEHFKIPDIIAGSDHCIRNEPIPFGMDIFPHEWECRYSDLFYPVTKTYIDTPTGPHEVERCERKLKAYKAKGVRYTYIADNEDVADVQLRLAKDLPNGKIETKPPEELNA